MKKMGFFTLHYDPPLGGAERSMHNYFKILSKYLDIHVFCFLDENGSSFRSYSYEEKDGIKIYKCNNAMNNVISNFINKEKPNLIGTQLLGSDLVVEHCNRANIPVYFFAHGLFEDVCQHYLLTSCKYNDLLTCDFGSHCPNAFQHGRNVVKYNNCKKIFCNSEYTKIIFNRMFPECSTEIDILYPNLNFDYFYKNKNVPEIIRNKKSILAVNSMPLKGRNIIKSFASMNPDFKVIYVDCKKDDIEFLKESPNIEIHGKVSKEKLLEFYRSVGAVVCPTFMQETFGGVVAESILTETPVVCMNKGNLPNLVIDKHNGFIINSMSVHEWSDKILKAVEMNVDPKYSEKLYNKINTEINIEKIKKEFCSEEKVASATEEIKEKKKKKILFFARFFYPPLGGGEYFILSVFKHLKKLGYDCIGAGYCDPKTNSTFSKEEVEVINWDGIPAHKLYINTVADIQEFYKKEKPDLIVTHSYDAPIFIDIAKKMGIKTILGTHFWRNICEVRDNFVNMLERPPSSFRLLLNNHRVFDIADEKYVNSEFMRLGVQRYTGRNIERVIHPIIDISRSLSYDRNPDSAEYITLVNPDKGKGGFLFVDLAKKMPNYKFLCVGLGSEICPKNKQINMMIKNIPNIKLIDKADKMADVYNKTKILLVPSLVDETFSMVALEAMANGIPVLASPNGNLKFLIEKGGRLLDTNNVSDWIENIQNLFNNKEDYNVFSLEAKKTAKKYDPQVELAKFEEMVKNCIGDAS